MKIIYNNLKILFLLFALNAFVVSCEPLDKEPLAFVTPDNFYNTPGQIEAAFAASMNELWRSWGSYGYPYSIFHTDQWSFGNLVIPANHGANLWAAHYKAILNINSAIRAMNEGNLEGVAQEDIDKLMGQAKFLRGYNYFMLVRMFGALPLMTEDIEDTFADVARSPLTEVYELITNDLQEAAAKLPPTWPSDKQGRPTRDAAKGLLSKVYLTMATHPLNEPSNYQKAADMAWEVIQADSYSLVQDIDQVFSVATKYGPEIMFSFNSNYEDKSTSPQVWTSLRGWGDLAADPVWAEEFPEQPRKYAWLETELNGVPYTELGRRPGIQKYLYDTEEDFNAGRSIVNIPIIRFADVLLIYAEAANMANGGPTRETIEAINKVIDRANGYVEIPEYPRATMDMSMEAFDSKVIEERNWELAFEFDRWFDLVRKRILEEESREEIRQNFSEADYLFPIPINDIRLNPSLTQNPGY